jgi:predicted negative regulator of RcsB-dependent stress response
MRWRNSLLFFLLVVSADAAYVVTLSGRQINGTEISATEDGSITLKTASGQSMTFREGQYRSAAADKPKELDQASRLLRDGKGEQAVPLLRKVKAGYRFLAWDQEAIRLLADYYFEREQYAEAAREFQALENFDDPVVQSRHREALLKSGNTDAVLPALEKDIAEGSREAAAEAYLMRGDLKAANGDSEGARRDWLKVATFFKAQNDLAEQAEQKLGNHEPDENKGQP